MEKVAEPLGGSSREVRGSWKQLGSAQAQGRNEPCWSAPADLVGDSDERQAEPSPPLCLGEPGTSVCRRNTSIVVIQGHFEGTFHTPKAWGRKSGTPQLMANSSL